MLRGSQLCYRSADHQSPTHMLFHFTNETNIGVTIYCIHVNIWSISQFNANEYYLTPWLVFNCSQYVRIKNIYFPYSMKSCDSQGWWTHPKFYLHIVHVLGEQAINFNINLWSGIKMRNKSIDLFCNVIYKTVRFYY